MNKKSIILSLVSGLLLFLSFPKYGHAVFAWVALVPLLISIREVRAGTGLRLGFQ